MRPRKPRALKLLENNPGKRPIPAEPKPEAILPDPPPWLDEVARGEWHRKAAVTPKGVLTVVDDAVFGVYCQAFSDVCRYAEVLGEVTGPDDFPEVGELTVYVNKAGAANYSLHPVAKLLRESFDRMTAAAVQLGFTPSSRSRVSISKAESEDSLDAIERRRAEKRKQRAGA